MEENNRGLLVTRSAIILHYRGHMARVKKIKSPTQLELVEPLFAVLVELGGSATIDEIRDNIIKKLKLSDDVVDEPHKGNASQQTELEYQLAWARTRLKNLGAIVNSKRGVWMITPEYAGRKSITREEVTENIKVTKLKDKTEKEVDTILQDGDSSNDGIDTIEDSESGTGGNPAQHEPLCFRASGNATAPGMRILPGYRYQKIQRWRD